MNQPQNRRSSGLFQHYPDLADVDGTARAAGYDSTTIGLAGGADVVFRTSEGTVRAGVAAGYTTTDIDSRNADAEIDTWHVGAHASMSHGPLLLACAAAVGFQSYDLSRTIPLVGAAPARATSETDGVVVELALEASYDLASYLGIGVEQALRIAPVASLDHVNSRRDGYTETGAGVLNLTLGDDSFNRTWLGLGVELAATFTDASGTRVTPSLAVKYEHGLGDDQAAVNSAIAGVAGATFSDVGAVLDDHALGVNAGLDIDFSDQFGVTATYAGSFGAGTTTHRGGLTESFRF